MALQPSNTGLGETYSSMISGGNFPSALRPEGIDESTKLTFLTRDVNAFTYVIHKSNLGNKKSIVKERIFKAREISEFNRIYPVTVPSLTLDSARHSIFGIANDLAHEIKENTVMYITGLYVNLVTRAMRLGQVTPATVSAVGTNIGPDTTESAGNDVTGLIFSRQRGLDAASQSYFTDYEQIKVITVGAPDSAGTGSTAITVERCYMGPGEGDTGGRKISGGIVYSATVGVLRSNNGGANDTTNPHARILVGDIITMGMPTYFEGTTSPTGVYKNPTIDENYTQEYKFAVEQTAESKIVESSLYIKESGLDINRMLTIRVMNRMREYSSLMNRKMRNQSNGKEEFISGGVIPWLFKDQEHYIIYPQATITWPQLMRSGTRLFWVGGSNERTGFLSATLMAEFRASFWENGFLQYNPEASKSFNMEVNTLNLSGGRIHLIASQVMEENGWGSAILCLDLKQSDAFEPVTNSGWDYKVIKDVAPKDSNIYKEVVQGMFGMKRRFRPFHLIWDFSLAMQNSIPLTGVQPTIRQSQDNI